jgi:uncharacterized lipoprotein YajG
MVTRLLSILAALTVLAGCASAPPAPAAITTETFMIPAADPGIQLHVIFARLTSAPYRRLVLLSEGTHAIVLEKNRMHLIRQVQEFLEEPAS